tara:strand:+ start:1560 stop:1751 length:192 start_codon:yes stop_codon:yes gene_type:complete
MSVDSKKLKAGLAKTKKKRTLKDDYEKYLERGLSKKKRTLVDDLKKKKPKKKRTLADTLRKKK